MRKKLILSLVAILVLAYGGLISVLATGTTPALGLDLQGGISVTQKPKEGTEWSTQSLDLAVERIRDRVDSLGVAEPEILRQGDTVVVNLPGVKNQEEAIKLVQVTGQVWLRPVLQCGQQPDPNAPVTTDSTVPGSSTPDGTGSTTATSAPATTAQGGPQRADHVGATPTSTPGSTTPDTTTTDTTDGSTSTTVAGPLDIHGYPLQESDPTTIQILPVDGKNADGSFTYCYVGAAYGDGEVFTNAKAATDNGQWLVRVDLRGGSKRGGWDTAVTQCYNKASDCPTGQLAIELDGVIESYPVINDPSYTDSVQITGQFTQGEAESLARVLNSGSLPVQLEVLSTQNVSPTLGKDSLKAAWLSGLIGVGLVLLFMVLYYRTLGLIVAAGLTVSISLLWAVISILSKTQGLALSLSGIAGIIVSVGVTVDSYVVFFERLKDEVRAGRTLRNSAQRGFSHAWRTIVVADLVSLIGALVLWYLTVGAVRGFAFFLGLSTLCDLVVSYFFTRPTVMLLARTRWMERRKVMGIEVTTQGGAA
ncbi:MAG TPA: protein translocase subunit SecD [Ilumatobacteraceae bacterium]|nr:protein translocase subunit SecD [Ilumatobacteraceae bacterium]